MTPRGALAILRAVTAGSTYSYDSTNGRAVDRR